MKDQEDHYELFDHKICIDQQTDNQFLVKKNNKMIYFKIDSCSLVFRQIIKKNFCQISAKKR